MGGGAGGFSAATKASELGATAALKHGRACSRFCVSARGDPLTLTADEVILKYLDCVDFVKTLTGTRQKKPPPWCCNWTT